MSDGLIFLAIDEISNADFEKWVQKVLATIEDIDFAPAGGIHDGGQDGFIRTTGSQVTHYIQITKQKDTRTKVRKTIEDIRKKRQLDQLTLVTSQIVQDRDLLEAQWGNEFSLKLKIHDRNWLLAHASFNRCLRDDLYSYVKDTIDEITRAASVPRKIENQDHLSIITYLESQAKTLPKTENFQNICLDIAIYSVLQDADNPQNKIFKTSEDIRSELEASHAQLLSKAPARLEDRLEFLSSKGNSPRLNRYPDGKFALPHEVLNQFSEFNLKIQNQEKDFLASLSMRIKEQKPEIDNEMHSKILGLVRDSLHKTFHQQAMNFANSFSNSTEEVNIEVFSIIRDLAKDLKFDSSELEISQELAATVFRKACYSSEGSERVFLEMLMKYYSVQFVMHGDAIVSEYFSEMSKRLRVYLGADIIVRCMSETFVKEKSRGMTNALSRIQLSGVTLLVTRRTLEEVFSHLHKTYLTFRDHYEKWYRNGSLQEIKQSDEILIRAFGYAYFEPRGHTRQPRDWSDFLNQFGLASWFSHPTRNIDDFGSFLKDMYKFKFVEFDGVTSKIDSKLAQEIANSILNARGRGATRGHAKLALNDAQMALLVTAERTELNERVTTDLYGYNTWWMTEETKILRELKRRKLPANVVMHPQFLINHLLLDQTTLSKNHQRQDITPTLFGLQITDRVPNSVMKKFLDDVRDVEKLGEVQQRARIRAASNQLKSGGSRAALK